MSETTRTSDQADQLRLQVCPCCDGLEVLTGTGVCQLCQLWGLGGEVVPPDQP